MTPESTFSPSAEKCLFSRIRCETKHVITFPQNCKEREFFQLPLLKQSKFLHFLASVSPILSSCFLWTLWIFLFCFVLFYPKLHKSKTCWVIGQMTEPEESHSFPDLCQKLIEDLSVPPGESSVF